MLAGSHKKQEGKRVKKERKGGESGEKKEEVGKHFDND